jgi:hypothetical protein
MQDHVTAREKLAALAQLPIDDAMDAIVRLQAVMLAGLGILPGSPAFDRVAIAYLALLAEKDRRHGQGACAPHLIDE